MNLPYLMSIAEPFFEFVENNEESWTSDDPRLAGRLALTKAFEFIRTLESKKPRADGLPVLGKALFMAGILAGQEKIINDYERVLGLVFDVLISDHEDPLHHLAENLLEEIPAGEYKLHHRIEEAIADIAINAGDLLNQGRLDVEDSRDLVSNIISWAYEFEAVGYEDDEYLEKIDEFSFEKLDPRPPRS